MNCRALRWSGEVLTTLVTLAAVSLMPTMALAHHPMGGMTQKTLWHGFLSGVGHPVLGPDHLAFIIGIGVLIAMSKRWLWLPVAFVATLVPGVLAHYAGMNLGPHEVFVALSVVVLGGALLVESRLPAAALAGAVLIAGFFHGFAFGETIVGAEATPILAYLVGLSVTIVAMATLIAWITRGMVTMGMSQTIAQRLAAGLLLVGGGVFTVQSMIG